MDQKLRSISLALFLLVACRHAEKEADRTSKQLESLAKASGTDGLFESVQKNYQENVQPLVKSANATIDSVDSLRTMKEMGARACENAAEIGASIGRSADRAISGVPQNERELNSTVDYYSDAFADWIRENFFKSDGGKSDRIKSRLGPRGKPKIANR